MKWQSALRRSSLTIGLTYACATLAQAQTTPNYNVGVGISDITGEAAEIGMMGYAQPEQKAAGIHQRLRTRAYVVEDPVTHKSVMMVVCDLSQINQAVHQEVMRRLNKKYGGLYNEKNVVLTATHTHAAPGGASHYAMYNLTILGFQEKTFKAYVDGIMEAIAMAHQDKAIGGVRLSQGELINASVNRSAWAFDANAASDRAAFPMRIDPLMSTLAFNHSGQDIGAMNFFAVHNTSLTSTNTLISPDNKGYASYHIEHDQFNGRYAQRKIPFVSSFPQTNAGDMSPNLNLRPGSGPTDNEFENARIIGTRQADMSSQLLNAQSLPLSGSVDYRMRYVDMSKLVVRAEYSPDGQTHTTCPAAMGTAFAVGSTEDGASGLGEEGKNNPMLAVLGNAIFGIVPNSVKVCHGNKEIMAAPGLMKPYPWVPEVLPVQLLKVGQFYMATLPHELTVISGYRIRKQLASTLGVDVRQVLAVGYSNAYAGYLTTKEEYDLQNYEGGSTYFGPYQLAAYTQELDTLAKEMKQGVVGADNGLRPRDLSAVQMNLQTGVVMDAPAIGKQFGSVLQDAFASYTVGSTVAVRFQTGHPKNNLHRNGTFLQVQRWDPITSTWAVVADDGDWSTKFRWTRTFGAESVADITWDIPAGTVSGKYRILHFGDAKDLLGAITPFTGMSREFTVQ